MLFSFPACVKVNAAAEEITVNVPFIANRQIINWDFPYSDDYFSSSGELSLDLARSSFGLAVSAFRNDGYDLPDQYETFLKAAGFTDIVSFGYDQPTSPDSLSGVIAQKKIGDVTLIAAVPCGQGYGKEWAGNFTVGSGDIHEGFEKAAGIFEKEILDYIREHDIDGSCKLWLTGFSRASAVSNITAAGMIDSGLFEDVFAYLFAVPRTTKNPKNASGVIYPGIYNFCGKYDPVTQIPLESWGFEHYGLDFYTPAQENDPAYAQKARETADVYFRLTDGTFYNNPEVNHQLHMIIEFIGEMFPTNEAFAEKLQDKLVNVVMEQNLDNFLLLLTEAVEQMEDLDQREKYSSEILIRYLSYIMSQHIGEEDKQVKEGRWDPDASITENLMREHLPSIYLSWLFSSDSIQDLLAEDIISRTISIRGDADVEVMKDGRVIGGAYRDGTIRSGQDYSDLENTDPADFYSSADNVCLIRNGPDTVIIVPSGLSYDIVLKTDDSQDINYYQIFRTPYFTFGWSDDIALFKAEKGEYHLKITENEESTGDFEAVSGSMTSVRHFDYPYSPLIQMAEEIGGMDYLSIRDLILILIWSFVFIIVILAVCLGLFIAHAQGKRKKGKTYSDWYVIIPHLVLIVFFTVMNRFFTSHMFAVVILRQACAAAAMLLIFLMALRGTIRHRNAWSVSVTVLLLILNVIGFFFCQNDRIFNGSAGSLMLTAAIVLALTLAALSTFFVRKK